MIYDLHVHINPHADEGEIYEYEIYAKMRNMHAVGFVIHYVPAIPDRVLRDFRDIISTFTIKSYAGVEIYYPAKKIPKGFDYYLYHFSNTLVDAEILNRMENAIISHPFSYGMRIDESAIPVIEKRNIAVELNSAHFSVKLREFYNKLRSHGILIPFGSDAHNPQEIASGFEDLTDIFSPYEDVEKFIGW